MILNREIAKKLEPLLNPDVEKAIILLLNWVLLEKETIFENPHALDSELRQFQGQKVLISELKDYKKRLGDAILREKEQKDNAILGRP